MPDERLSLNNLTKPCQVQAALQAGEPVISVDAKKKELVGDFKVLAQAKGHGLGSALLGFVRQGT